MICEEPINPAGLLARFTERAGNAGAVVSFTGTVRGGGGVKALELEYHPSFTAKVIDGIAGDARARFDLVDCLVVHRAGSLAPGEPIVFVAAASAHRRAAFEAVDYLMDRLKTEAPLWKRELRADGAEWIEARASDLSDRARWEDKNADR